ncbi:MAG: zinc ribbon-containing protein [Chromatiales bacterium]|nr:zinc ribbon-containing protein [Chromatiales bacterium]
MSENEPQHHERMKRLTDAYERMLEHVSSAIDKAGHETLPTLKRLLADAREAAVEFGEITREEAEKVSHWVHRDVEHAAEFQQRTGNELRDWLRFDIEQVEARFMDWFALATDTSRVVLGQWAERASHYHTGEITGPGRLTCENCGAHVTLRAAGPVPHCPQCDGTEFQREEP